MEFKLSLILFKELVKLVNLTVPNKPYFPSLATIKLTAEIPNKLSLQSFDLSDGTELITESVNVVSPGSVLIMGKELLSLLSVLTGETIEIRLKANNNTANQSSSFSNLIKTEYDIELKTDTQVVFLPLINADEFPDIPAFTPVNVIGVIEAELYDALNKTIKVASPDETKQVMTGINLSCQGKLMIAATNGHCLTVACIDLLNNTSLGKSVTINKNIVNRLLKFLKPSKPDSVYLEFEETRIQVGLEVKIQNEDVEIKLLSRIVDGTYPAVTKLFPPESTLKIATDKEQLTQAFALSSIFADAAKLVSVYEYNEDGQQLISGEKDATGKSVQIVDCEAIIENAPIKVGINPKYMQMMLSTYQSTFIELGFTMPTAPILIQGQNELIECKSIIMPIQLRN